MNITQILKEVETWTPRDIADLQECLKELSKSKRAELNRRKRIQESELAAVHNITDHFESWEDKNKPPLLSRDNIAPGRQFRLSASQMSWIRERFGAAVGSSVVVPYDIELNLEGQAVAFSAKTGISKFAPKKYLTYFRVYNEDAEIFFRQELDEPTTPSAGRTRKVATRKKREEALLQALLGHK